MPLNESASVVLDATGAGSARLGPGAAGVVWQVSLVSVFCSVSNPMPIGVLYLGSPAPSNIKDGTYSAALNSTTYTVPVELHAGQYFTMVWTGGQPGATGTVTAQGTKVI